MRFWVLILWQKWLLLCCFAASLGLRAVAVLNACSNSTSLAAADQQRAAADQHRVGVGARASCSQYTRASSLE
jgi:hypothetical protein